jgi:hypothetical protein
MLIGIIWDPLAPDWSSQIGSRLYKVVYEDNLGNIHRTTAKTSMIIGVYFINDTVIKNNQADGQTAQSDLKK